MGKLKAFLKKIPEPLIAPEPLLSRPETEPEGPKISPANDERLKTQNNEVIVHDPETCDHSKCVTRRIVPSEPFLTGDPALDEKIRAFQDTYRIAERDMPLALLLLFGQEIPILEKAAKLYREIFEARPIKPNLLEPPFLPEIV